MQRLLLTIMFTRRRIFVIDVLNSLGIIIAPLMIIAVGSSCCFLLLLYL